MSLILEALRKSETERRRGQAPDVLADMPAARPATRRTAPAWLWLLPLVVVLLAMLWLLRDRETPLPEVTYSAPVQQAATDREQPPEPALPPVQRLTPSPVASSPPARAVAGPPSPTRTVDPSQANSFQDNSSQADRSPVAPDKQASLPTSPAIVAPPRAAPLPATSPAIPTRTPDRVATAQPAPVQANSTGIASLSDLTTTQRESLPPLKISMHLWNADPARRFVILDGNRVVEGDRVGDAVVKDITTDGVVIDWHGQRIKLPIR